MERVLGRYSPYLYAILRIVAGLMFMIHGTQKLLGLPGGKAMPLASMPGIAGVIEIVCGTLILVGLFTGVAAFIASGEMAFAYFIAHAPRAPLPIQNQGELAVIYCFLFLYIATHGSGIWSVDSIRRPRQERGPVLLRKAS